MSHIAAEDWKFECFCMELPVFVCHKTDGWFARTEHEEMKLTAISGPWPTLSDALYGLQHGVAMCAKDME